MASSSPFLDLAHPRSIGDRPPPRADLVRRGAREGPRREQGGVFTPSIRLGRPHDGRVDAWRAHGEAQGRGDSTGLHAQERIVESPKPHPVVLVVGLGRLPLVAPRHVRDRPLRDDAHSPLYCQRQRELEGLLVGNTHRGLEGVEPPALDGVARRLPVAAIADEPRHASFPRALERRDGLTLLQMLEGAAVELNEIDRVCLEPAQAPLDALEERGAPPVSAPEAPPVSALREEMKVAAAAAHRLADELFAVLVALRGVDHVETGVESAAEEPRHCTNADPLVTDLRTPEAENAHGQTGLAERPSLHARQSARTRSSRRPSVASRRASVSPAGSTRSVVTPASR